MFWRSQFRIPLLQAALFTLAFGPIEQIRADSYGYSVQQTNSYVVTGATVGAITPFSSSSAAQTASPSGSESQVGADDSLQSYVGLVAGRPSENTFTPKGTTTPDYTRGDALVTVPPTAFSTSNVAEGFLATPGLGTGTGAWSVSFPLTLTMTGAVSLSFSFSNQLTLTNTSAPGSVTADFSWIFGIQDASGTLVFSSAPSEVNRTMSLTSGGSISIPDSGTITITTSTLGAGTYTGTISGSEHTFINTVPEPSTYLLLGSGLALLGYIFWRRHPVG